MRAVLLLLAIQAADDPPALIRALRDESPALRERAEAGLRRRGEDVLPFLHAAAADPDPELAGRARALVERIRWDQFLDPLLPARYEGFRVAVERQDAALVLDLARRHGLHDEQGDLEAFGYHLLEHPPLRVQGVTLIQSATNSPNTVPRRDIPRLLRILASFASEEPDPRTLQAVATLAYDLVSPLDRERLAAASSPRPEVAAVLAVLRARAGVPGARALLPGLLDTAGEPALSLALRAVRELRCDDARPQVLRLLRSPNMLFLAADAAVAVEDAACRTAYADLWRETPPNARTHWHLELFARSGSPDVEAVVLRILADGPTTLQYTAATSAARLRLRSALDILLSPAADPNVANAYLEAAREIVGADDVHRLIDRLERADPATLFSVHYALTRLPDPEARRRLIERLVEADRGPLRDRLFDVARQMPPDDGLERVPDSTLEPLVRDGIVGAAEALLKRRGRSAVALIEDAALQNEEKGPSLLALLAGHPSSRGVAAAERWMQSRKGDLLPYLEAAATPEADAALARLAGLPDHPHQRSAALALARRRGEPPPPFEWISVHTEEGRAYIAAVASDAPGAREDLRRRVREKGPRSCLDALKVWAHPEMIPALRSGLAGYDQGLQERLWDERAPSCTYRPDTWSGPGFLEALVATGDRSVVPLLLERLEDADRGVRAAAVEAVGSRRVAEAAPMLRRLVRSGNPQVRARALLSLARIGGPDARPFVESVLRDNPHAAPFALARLGARDALEAVGRLLQDGTATAAVVGALELLAHPDAYAGLDDPLPWEPPALAPGLPDLLRKHLRRPVRVTTARPLPPASSHDGTVRGALEEAAGLFPSRYRSVEVAYVFRDGVVRICDVEEARAYWKARLRLP